MPMAISFGESLKKAAVADQAVGLKAMNVANMEISMTSAPMSEDHGNSTLDETGLVAAYSGDDGNWTQHPDYDVFRLFSDENISVIDDRKEIVLNEKQFNITQEENSQYIPFELSRYYDGFDLVQSTIWIHYTTKSGQHGKSKAINVSYNDQKIRFGWLIDAGPTTEAGKLQFEIQAYGVIVSQSGEQRGYVWKTKPNDEMTVLESLCNCNCVITEIDDSWMQELVIDIAERIAEEIANASIEEQVVAAENYAQEAKNAADEAKNTVATAKTELEQSVESAVQNEVSASLSQYSTTTEMVSEIDARLSSSLSDYSTAAEVDTLVDGKISSALQNHYTKDETNELLANIDISEQLDEVKRQIENLDGLANFDVEYDGSTMTFYNGDAVIKEIPINSDPSVEWTTSYTAIIDDKISTATTEVQDDLDAYKATTDSDLTSIHEAIDGLPKTLQDDYYNKVDSNALFATKEELASTDSKLSSAESNISANKTDIGTLSGKVVELQSEVDSIDKSPRLTYEATYNEEQIYTLWEIEGEGDTEVRTPKGQFKISGGGGSSTSSVLKIEYVTKTPLVATVDDAVKISYIFSGTDSSGDAVQEGTATWKVAGTTIATQIIAAGENSFDVTNYLNVGTQKVTLSITDDAGSLVTKSWTVQVIDVRLESTFNDRLTYPIGDIAFGYTPYGAISKDVHFVLDGEELSGVTTSASGIPLDYTLPAQEHGSHLLEVYMTAELSSNTIESNHIMKDILCLDPSSNVPIIGCTQQSFTAKQYDTTNIIYTVIDPKTETPVVELSVDGDVVATLTLEASTQVWQYKSTEIGEHTLNITCGETVKTLKAVITELGINVVPVTAGLAFDFNPVGRSNNDNERLWSDGDVSMTVSDNFDWVNGGYQLDDNGDQYFCIKAGTSAVINYQLFSDDAKVSGKEMKVVFKTSNIKKRDTTFLSCMNGGIGLEMKVESANIYSSNGSLYSPYCEDDIIEFEFNISRMDDIPLVLTYEDGVGNRPMIYTSDASFWQAEPQYITVGSADCDVHIYRIKAYKNSLSDSNILSNFIADARNADEMIDRHNRNQIYDENSALTPEILAERCPDLRIIMLDAPWFTNDKDNKVDDTVVRMIYKNGDPILDNWTCTGARHSGQGTSSNEYGYAGRNIDLIMNRDSSLFTFGDNSTGKTITLTRDSVPTDYLNVKVNIASSENQNNAQMARRYNQYNPFVRAAKHNDSKVKDCMEFFNCVIFIRERDEDISTHREFNDTNYHFYAIGNVGDSKKTDNTRMNNASDPKECVVEITDYNVPLAEFPTGRDGLCSLDDWKEGNVAYDYLYAEYKYKEGEFKSFGAESYEFRYEMDGITEEQREANINAWRDFYKFVVTSSDEDFHACLNEYFVVDSALYYYLFTERYTMVDNRAKNSFWHYGKVYITAAEAETLGGAGGYVVDDEQAGINEGYRWDLSFGYDFDTSLGIDNTGKLVLTYGKEDADYYTDGDPSSSYIYRAAESTFFCRLRDLFASELQGMFVDREDANAWSSNSLINQWDAAQSQFPEELWRLDIQRKYIRTYRGISVDNSIAKEANPRFLIEMLNGRKRYQRRMFERNQELYMATKYFGKTATQDQIMVRFNNPENYVVKPNFTLLLTPYSDMYIGVKFGNVEPINFRAKAGIEYEVPYSIAAEVGDITLIYGASFIQAVGDLSAGYVGDNDFSKASRLQRLIIGSNIEGYENTYMTSIKLENNKLLEYLDVRKITGLSTPLDLSKCGNLVELRAEGSGATGVIFANGGKVERFYIPDVTSLTAKNLNYLQEYSIESLANLQTLIVENTPVIDTYLIVETAIDVQNVTAAKLGTVRLVGIDWSVDNTEVLDHVRVLRGVNSEGAEISQSVLTGIVHIPTIGQLLMQEYKETWPDLEIDCEYPIVQYQVTFVNDDGSVLDIQNVNVSESAVDPITRENNPIPTPTKESTVSHSFTYAGWDSSLENVIGNRTIVATYTSALRSYTIKYVSKGVVQQQSVALYGEYVPYVGNIPTYVGLEVTLVYNLFKRWDKSGFVDGDKTINAEFDTYDHNIDPEFFTKTELKDMTPVQIYAMTKLAEKGLLVIGYDAEQKESDPPPVLDQYDTYMLNVGNDYDYEDIESEIIISEPMEFDGSTYYDTGIQLFDEDRDFVIAVDYKFSPQCAANGVLAECYDGNNYIGFKLRRSSSSASLLWGSTSSETLDVIGSREILVIRHQKGNTNLIIYRSNLSGASISTSTIVQAKEGAGAGRLVFGAANPSDGRYNNNATGAINWCKIWYADLGDDVCKSLSMWPHENIEMNACKFDSYYLADGSGKQCSFTLLANSLLSCTRNWGSSNSIGWNNSPINTLINDRFYKALPEQIRALVKQVNVPYLAGDGFTEKENVASYVTIPAYAQLDPMVSSDIYKNEDTTIKYMTTDAARMRQSADGSITAYFTRTPNVANAYAWSVNANGRPNGYSPVSNYLGILIMISF